MIDDSREIKKTLTSTASDGKAGTCQRTANFTFLFFVLVCGLLFLPVGKVLSQQQQPNIYKGPVDPNRPAPGKFRKGNSTPVAGEYIVILRKDIPSEQVKAIAQEFVEKHGNFLR